MRETLLRNISYIVTVAHDLLTKNKFVVIFITVIGLLASLYAFFPHSTPIELPSRIPFLLYHSGTSPKVEVINPTSSDLFIHGTSFDRVKLPKSEARMLPSGYSYFLNADTFIDELHRQASSDGSLLLPFRNLLNGYSWTKVCS
jgi:hypothetical protein